MKPLSTHNCPSMVTSNVGRYVPKDELIFVGGTLLRLFPYIFLNIRSRLKATLSTHGKTLWEGSLHIGAFTHLLLVPP